MEKKVKFFQQCLRFDESKVKPEQFHTIVLDFSTKIQLNQGWNLFQEGDPTDSLYLIKKGELQLSKQLKYTLNETTQTYDYEIENDTFNLDESLTNPSTSKKGKIKMCQIDFVIVSDKEFIGSEDLFYNKKHRTYTAKCLTDVTVYMIQKSQLLKLINEFFFFKLSLQKYALSKSNHHKERIEIVANAKKINLEQNQKTIASFRGNSQRDIMTSSASDKKSLFSKQSTLNFPENYLQSGNKSNTVLFSSKKSSTQGTFNSAAQINNPSLNYIKHQDSISSTAIQSTMIPSLQLIEEQHSAHSSGTYHLSNGMINSQTKSQKFIDKKTLHTQPIMMSDQNEDSQQLEDFKFNFGLYNRLSTNFDDTTESTSNSTQNAFWFDNNLKTQLDKKINHSIKEKDPTYIKKIRQTFKGNMESCKFGLLDKKLSKLISSKPKLISTALNSNPNSNGESEQHAKELLPQLPVSVTQSRKASNEIISLQKEKSNSPIKAQLTQTNQFGSYQQIRLPFSLQQESPPQMKQTQSQLFRPMQNSNSASMTPKNKSLKPISYGFTENNTPRNRNDDYQLSVLQNIQKRQNGVKSTSMQLSPIESNENKYEQQGTQMTLQIRHNEKLSAAATPKAPKKFQHSSFSIQSQTVQTERGINRKQLYQHSNFGTKTTFFSPRESFNTSSSKKLSSSESHSTLFSISAKPIKEMPKKNIANNLSYPAKIQIANIFSKDTTTALKKDIYFLSQDQSPN